LGDKTNKAANIYYRKYYIITVLQPLTGAIVNAKLPSVNYGIIPLKPKTVKLNDKKKYRELNIARIK